MNITKMTFLKATTALVSISADLALVDPKVIDC